MQTKTIKISDLHLNTGQIKDVPKNPRFIKDERYEALKKSIEDDPEMLQLREIVAYDNNRNSWQYALQGHERAWLRRCSC